MNFFPETFPMGYPTVPQKDPEPADGTYFG